MPIESIFTNTAKARMLAAYFNSGADFRVILCMEDTSMGAENDGMLTLSDYAAIDESDDTGYARLALTGEAVVKTDADDTAKMVSDNPVFTGLAGNGTKPYVGAFYYEHVDGNPANDIAGFFQKFTPPASPGGTIVEIPVDALGIAFVRQVAA